jgi:hypothetical protein
VPFHALVELNVLVGKRTQVTAPGYFALHRKLLRQLRTVRAVAKSQAKS